MNRNFFSHATERLYIFLVLGNNPIFILMADIRHKTNKRQKGEVILQNERFRSKEQIQSITQSHLQEPSIGDKPSKSSENLIAAIRKNLFRKMIRIISTISFNLNIELMMERIFFPSGKPLHLTVITDFYSRKIMSLLVG